MLQRRFNVYVAQPEVKPGCVLRRSNVRELETRKLVDSKEARCFKRAQHNNLLLQLDPGVAPPSDSPSHQVKLAARVQAG